MRGASNHEREIICDTQKKKKHTLCRYTDSLWRMKFSFDCAGQLLYPSHLTKSLKIRLLFH